MTEHKITIDQEDNTGEEGDTAFKAFCVCGWAGYWHHSDDYAPGDWESDPSAAMDEAEKHAAMDANAHMVDSGALDEPEIVTAVNLLDLQNARLHARRADLLLKVADVHEIDNVGQRQQLRDDIALAHAHAALAAVLLGLSRS